NPLVTVDHSDPRWQKNLYALALVQFLSLLSFSAVTPIFPLFMQELGVKNLEEAAFWAGVSQFSSGFCAFLAGPLWGALADRYGRKPMVVRASAAGIVLVALSGLAPSVLVLILTRAAYGAFTGVASAASALVASEVPRGRLAFALGLLQVSFFLGLMVGPLVGGVLADAFGHRVPFFVMAGLQGVALLIVVRYVRERFSPVERADKRIHPIRDVRLVLGLPHVVPLLGVLLAIGFGPFMLQPIMAVFMQGMVAEGAATAAGVALSFIGLTSSVASLAVGRLGLPSNLLRAVVIAAFVAALFYVPLIWIQSPVASILLFGVVGLCQGTLLTAINSLLSTSVSREHQGAVFGVVQSVNALSVGTASLVGGTMTVALGLRSVIKLASNENAL
ncbi:MAG: MFS transporter, partial [Chloroflexota bacterium]